MDYEYLILNNVDEDNTADECATCPYKGELCNSQCMDIIEIYNPYINEQEAKQWEVVQHYCLLSQLRIAFYKLNSENELEVLRMTYRNNYTNENRNTIWIIATHIKRRYSFTLGNALLNMFC